MPDKKMTKAEKAEASKRELVMDEHKVPVEELVTRFQTSIESGLTSERAKEVVATEGLNQLSPPKQTPEWLKLLHTQTGFFALLLWGGSILCFVGYGLKKEKENLYLGTVLALVVLMTGIFEYLQERKSSDLMNSFKGMMPTNTEVWRDGTPSKINAINLCRGDIIKLKAGDKVPADCRILECSDDMKVDNSSLTGESDPLKREPHCTNEDYKETANLAFFGTNVPVGSAKAMVVNIGDHTFMGHIYNLAVNTDDKQTPINKEITHFVKIVSAVAITLGVSFFAIGAALGTNWLTNLVFMIGIIVANVPEGLLATVTVCLTLTAKRMHGKSVLVKNLESVETLGSTSCICSDKTGTLTQNIMTVAHIVYDLEIFDVESTMGPANFDPENGSFKALLDCSVLCNTAVFDSKSKIECDEMGDPLPNGKPIPFTMDVTMGDGSIEKNKIQWRPLGDASESAMIKFGQSQLDIMERRDQSPASEKGKVPFNSANKYQIQVVWDSEKKQFIDEVKGAPERILARCTKAMIAGEVKPMTDEMKQKINELNSSLAKRGMRVLAFAQKALDPVEYPEDYEFNVENGNFPTGLSEADYLKKVEMAKANSLPSPSEKQKEGLTYLGMYALIDPPRVQVPGAVAKCKTAGIKVIMVTGDHPETAAAISKKVGIIWGKTMQDTIDYNQDHGLTEGMPGWLDPDHAPAIVVPGWTFSVDTPAEVWDDILGHTQIVFARTSPQQKLIIVENCQNRKYIVAVTGDGVNDSPALKKADIGVAMGIMGTDVSKEAANMILLDDNFASIVSGVEEGRLIFDNLKKSIAYTLSSNIPEISPFLSFIVVQIPLPLSTVLILLVDLGTDMIPAISMAWENPEADIMARRPRDAEVDHLVTKKLVSFAYLQIGVIQALSGFYTYFTVLNDYGFQPSILPGLGAVDSWGKNTVHCKVTGGAWRDFKGAYCPCFQSAKENPGICGGSIDVEWWSDAQNRDIVITQCQKAGYIYWDQDTQLHYGQKIEEEAEVLDCAFPVRHLIGAETENEPSAFNPNDGQTYFSAQGELYLGGSGVIGMMSKQSILAIRGQTTEVGQPAGSGACSTSSTSVECPFMYEYLPYRSVTSAFFDRRWASWPTNDDEARGLGDGTDTTVILQFQPIGAWDITDAGNDLVGEAAMGHISDVVDVSTAEKNPLRITESMYQYANLDQSNNAPWLSRNKVANTDYFSYVCANLVESDVCSDATTCTDGSAAANCIEVRDSAVQVLQNARCTHQEAAQASGAAVKCLSGENDNAILLNIASRELQYEALSNAQCASFIGIIIVQWADLVICKTRWLSLKHQGMKNPVMNFALIWELILGAFLCYITPIGTALGTRDLRITHWFTAMPFSVFIVMYDETRKYLMRETSISKVDPETGKMERQPGWLERNTYY